MVPSNNQLPVHEGADPSPRPLFCAAFAPLIRISTATNQGRSANGVEPASPNWKRVKPGALLCLSLVGLAG
jgi:hypothetical protein